MDLCNYQKKNNFYYPLKFLCAGLLQSGLYPSPIFVKAGNRIGSSPQHVKCFTEYMVFPVGETAQLVKHSSWKHEDLAKRDLPKPMWEKWGVMMAPACDPSARGQRQVDSWDAGQYCCWSSECQARERTFPYCSLLDFLPHFLEI